MFKWFNLIYKFMRLFMRFIFMFRFLGRFLNFFIKKKNEFICVITINLQTAF